MLLSFFLPPGLAIFRYTLRQAEFLRLLLLVIFVGAGTTYSMLSLTAEALYTSAWKHSQSFGVAIERGRVAGEIFPLDRSFRQSVARKYIEQDNFLASGQTALELQKVVAVEPYNVQMRLFLLTYRLLMGDLEGSRRDIAEMQRLFPLAVSVRALVPLRPN